MFKVLQDGVYNIVSINNSRLGVNLTLPVFQPVVTEGEDAIFTLRPVISNDPGRTFDIGVGGYLFTGKWEDQVFATMNREQRSSWTIQYQPAQDAYTITLKDDNTAWSLPDIPNVAPGTPVTLQPATPTSFLPTQLFKFNPVQE